MQPVHQPVQGFDYAKQHLGQQGGDEETLPVSQDTLVMSLKIRDTPLSLEKSLQQDGTANKKSLTADRHKRYHCPPYAVVPITNWKTLLTTTISYFTSQTEGTAG